MTFLISPPYYIFFFMDLQAIYLEKRMFFASGKNLTLSRQADGQKAPGNDPAEADFLR